MIFDFFVIVDFVWSGLRKKIKDLDRWFFLSLLWTASGGVGGCLYCAGVFFWLDVFIIILMCYLYYFNEIVQLVRLVRDLFQFNDLEFCIQVIIKETFA